MKEMTPEETAGHKARLESVVRSRGKWTVRELYGAVFGEDRPGGSMERARRAWLARMMYSFGWERVQEGWYGTQANFVYRPGGIDGDPGWHRREIAETVKSVPDDRLPVLLRVVRMAERQDPRMSRRFNLIAAAIGAADVSDDGNQEGGREAGGGGPGEPAAEQANHGPDEGRQAGD